MGKLKVRMKNEKPFSLQKRRRLRSKLVKVLNPEMRTLSTDMQQILCDDLVTAIQNRLTVLTQVEPKRC